MKRQHLTAGILVAAGLVMAALACKPGPAKNVIVHRPECPAFDSVVIWARGHGGGEVPITHIPGSDPITGIPEFHDCQRFVRGDRYDSLYAIFAAFRLESLPAKLRLADSLAKLQGKAHGTVPVATIYSYGGTYPPLGIQPGFNCLFLFRDDGVWGAKMVSWGPVDPDCADRDPESQAAGTTLQVLPSTGAFTDPDYPPVARWDRAKGGTHYIGIKCGPAWCEVGQPGFVPSMPYTIPQPSFDLVSGLPATLIEMKRVTGVKGWYDAQELASVASGWARPSGVHGVLIPHPVLDRLNSVAGFKNRWIHVADAVLLDGDYKWTLRKGVNKIYLCHGSPASDGCNVDLAVVPTPPGIPLSSCPPGPDPDGFPWWMMVASAAGTREVRCVKRVDHKAELAQYIATHPNQVDIQIPGAARWRWMVDDESGWIRCPTGCCTGQ